MEMEEVKIRNGLVSNSSSCSFIIKKSKLSESQIKAICNHIEFAKIVDEHFFNLKEELVSAGYDPQYFDSKFEYESYFDYIDPWYVVNEPDQLLLGCTVDNFNMERFLRYIGLDEDDYETVEDTDVTWDKECVYPRKNKGKETA